MKAIHQLLAGFREGDAISKEAMCFRNYFRAWGFDSHLYCESKRVPQYLRNEIRDINGLDGICGKDDIALLHLSIGSEINDIFSSLSCGKAILYHSMTPAHYFYGVDYQVACELERGRAQARNLAGTASVVMADSRYNADDLKAMGYDHVHLLPLDIDFKPLAVLDRATRRSFTDGRKNILFVGRCAPNKRIEDIIHAFAYFQKFYQPDARLILVGSYVGLERYHDLLLATIRNLELEEVVFTGPVSQVKLNTIYRCASLFLCMSEHEGFCAPLIESMFHDLPVMAYAAAAVPETMGGAGVLIKEKNWEMIAEMMARLVHDQSLREAVLRKQRSRLASYRQQNLEQQLRHYLDPLTG